MLFTQYWLCFQMEVKFKNFNEYMEITMNFIYANTIIFINLRSIHTAYFEH